MFENKFGLEGFLLNFLTANKIKINSILEAGTENGNTIRKVIDYYKTGLFLVDDLKKFRNLKEVYKNEKDISFDSLDTKIKKHFDLIHINLEKASDFDYKDLKFKYLILSNIKEDLEIKLDNKELQTIAEINFKNKRCLILTTL
ncbi:MAG: hypothetical protein ACRCTS_03550 [Fusobacteriaceae bacterium]